MTLATSIRLTRNRWRPRKRWHLNRMCGRQLIAPPAMGIRLFCGFGAGFRASHRLPLSVDTAGLGSDGSSTSPIPKIGPPTWSLLTLHIGYCCRRRRQIDARALPPLGLLGGPSIEYGVLQCKMLSFNVAMRSLIAMHCCGIENCWAIASIIKLAISIESAISSPQAHWDWLR